MVHSTTVERLREQHLQSAPGNLVRVDVRPISSDVVQPLIDDIQGHVRVGLGELVLLREADGSVPTYKRQIQSVREEYFGRQQCGCISLTSISLGPPR